MIPAKTLVSHMFGAIDACRFDDLKAVMADDAVYQRPGYPACNGIEEILHFYRNVRVIRDGKHTLQDFVFNGEEAMTCGHFQGWKKDGSAIEIQYAEVYRFAGDKIAFRRSYFFTPAV